MLNINNHYKKAINIKQLITSAAVVYISLFATSNVYANNVDLSTDSDYINQKNSNVVEQKKVDLLEKKHTEEDSIVYLKNNQDLFERLLGTLLVKGQAIQLEKLLPEYQKLPNHDQSVIDWGQALIFLNQKKYQEAIKLYKKINAALPDLEIVRLQMTRALILNGQYQAAKLELINLKANTKNKNDLNVINQYLELVNSKSEWGFNGSVAYVNDKNLTNAPKKGTQLKTGGNSTTYSAERETGQGLDLSASVEKQWLFDNKSFIEFSLSSYGNYYFDNPNFDDITANVSLGTGYQDKDSSFKISHLFAKRWFAGGYGSDEKIKEYSETQGVNVQLGKSITPQLMYQGYASFNKTQHPMRYQRNDADSNRLSNTLVYFATPKTNYSVGLNYSQKDAEDVSNSNIRKGVSLGTSHIWNKGFATDLQLGYSQVNYKTDDFFGIKRKNNQFNAGLSLWNRQFDILGLTPKLNLNYTEVTSNSPFEEFDKYNANIKFSKTF